MAEQWISASQAKTLASSKIALCTRAHAGLVRARAKLLRIRGHRSEDADVPARFWWAGGHAALRQNWSAGDFSTWIERKHLLEAFGVTFAARDILEMLPPEQRGEAALRLSIAGDPNWLCARDAARYAVEAAALPKEAAPRSIIEQARLGFVNARAVEMTPLDVEGNVDASRDGAREWDVPPGFWSACMPAQDWALGIFQGTMSVGGELRPIRLSGVHFRREAITRALPVGATPTQAEAAAKNAGGRPPAAFSDDLMCAVWERIYLGELLPNNRATIKNALLDWASTNGHSLSETTAKEKARKIFNACQSEVENP